MIWILAIVAIVGFYGLACTLLILTRRDKGQREDTEIETE
jgi:hypothetical protein